MDQSEELEEKMEPQRRDRAKALSSGVSAPRGNGVKSAKQHQGSSASSEGKNQESDNSSSGKGSEVNGNFKEGVPTPNEQEDVKYREKDQSSERSSANRSSTCSEDGNYRKSWRSNSSASITSTGSAASWTVGMSSVDEVEESPQTYDGKKPSIEKLQYSRRNRFAGNCEILQEEQSCARQETGEDQDLEEKTQINLSPNQLSGAALCEKQTSETLQKTRVQDEDETEELLSALPAESKAPPDSPESQQPRSERKEATPEPVPEDDGVKATSEKQPQISSEGESGHYNCDEVDQKRKLFYLAARSTEFETIDEDRESVEVQTPPSETNVLPGNLHCPDSHQMEVPELGPTADDNMIEVVSPEVASKDQQLNKTTDSSERESQKTSDEEERASEQADQAKSIQVAGAKESKESEKSSDPSLEEKDEFTSGETGQCQSHSENGSFVAPLEMNMISGETTTEEKFAVRISSSSFESFTELIDGLVSDAQGVDFSFPVNAEDLFSNRSEIVVEKNSKLFKDLKDSKQFIETWSKCKLITLEIPSSKLACGCNCGPFTLEGGNGKTFPIKACLLIVGDSLYLGVEVHLQDESDDQWPIKKLVIVRTEKNQISQESSSCDDEVESTDKGFSFSDVEEGMEGYRAGENNSLYTGLEFISTNDLKKYVNSEGKILIYFLFLPLEAKAASDVKFERPVKIHEFMEPHPNNSHDEARGAQTCCSIRLQGNDSCKLPVSLKQCNRDLSVIQLYSGITLVQVKLPFNTCEPQPITETFFGVAMNTRSKYSMKLVVHVEANTMLSLGVAVLSGADDDELNLPLAKTIAFQLVNEDGSRIVEKGFQCNFLRCPQHKSSSAIGIQEFISLQELANGFITDGFLTIKVLVMPTEFEQNSLSQASLLSLKP